MISANSNVAVFAPDRRVVVEPMRFAYLTPAMQNSMIEWLEESRTDFCDVLANTAVVGRSTFLYDAENGRFLNAKALDAVLEKVEERLELIEDVIRSASDLDRPRAFRCRILGPVPDRINLVVLPITLDGCPVYAITVAEWS